jgi:ribosomal protein S19
MSRSIKKGPFFKGIHRASSIFPFCVGRTYTIHNGMQLFKVTVQEQMIGYKFGEFVRTRQALNLKQKKR